jgi:hypothetical protein
MEDRRDSGGCGDNAVTRVAFALTWLRRISTEVMMLCLLLAMATPSVAQPQPEPSSSDFRAFFLDLALSPIQRPLENVVVKWQKQIHVAQSYYAFTPPEVLDAMMKVFGEANKAANINVKLGSNSINTLLFFSDWTVGPPDKAALQLLRNFFSSDDEVVDFIKDSEQKNSACALHAMIVRDVISGAVILVNVGRSDTPALIRCSARAAAELVGIGFGNPAATTRLPSIANAKSNVNELTQNDRDFLKIFARDEIRPGMTAEEVSRVLASVMNKND